MKDKTLTFFIHLSFWICGIGGIGFGLFAFSQGSVLAGIIALLFGALCLFAEIGMLHNTAKNKDIIKYNEKRQQIYDAGLLYRLCIQDGITQLTSASEVKKAENIAAANKIPFTDIRQAFNESKKADEKVKAMDRQATLDREETKRYNESTKFYR